MPICGSLYSKDTAQPPLHSLDSRFERDHFSNAAAVFCAVVAVVCCWTAVAAGFSFGFLVSRAQLSMNTQPSRRYQARYRNPIQSVARCDRHRSIPSSSLPIYSLVSVVISKRAEAK